MIKTNFVSRNIHGWGSLSALPEEVKRFQANRVLIITDPFLHQNGLADQIAQSLASVGVKSLINSEVVPEPPLSVAEKLVAFARQQSIDLVIGLGGGSAIDLAKLVAAMVTQEGQVREYLNLTGTRTFEQASLAKIMIPTTSGTGSEVTNISVLSLENSKDVVVHEALLADLVMVDPELTLSVPPHVTAATGIDALTHAIESYVSIYATPISEALSLQAIRLIARSLVKAVDHGTDQQARTDMSYGSYLAGLAFFNAGCAAVHALAYPLGGQFHIPHGQSNAVLLPYVMGYIRSACEKKLTDVYEALGYRTSLLSQEDASSQCIVALQDLVKRVGIAPTLQAFQIPQSALPHLAKAAFEQKRLLQRSPMSLNEADILKIYEASYEGHIFC